MTQKRLLSIPLLALVVLSVLAPQSRPVIAQTPSPSLAAITEPRWGETVTFQQIYTSPTQPTNEFSSSELCGKPNDIMGYQFTAQSASGVGVYSGYVLNGTYYQITAGGPYYSLTRHTSDQTYGYYLGNPAQYPWPTYVVYNPLGTSYTNQNTMAQFSDGVHYADAIRINTGAWGGGSRTVNISLIALCSDTGTPPTPTPTPGPQKDHCVPVGKVETYDATDSPLTSGSLESVEYSDEIDTINATLQVTLPSSPVRNYAIMQYKFFGAGLGVRVLEEEIKINGVTFTRQYAPPFGVPSQFPEISADMIPVALPGQTFSVEISITLEGSNIDPTIRPYLGNVSVIYQSALAAGESLICDTSMEMIWDEAQTNPIPIDGSLSPWRELNEGDNNGRFTPSWLNALLQGGPTSAACHDKAHAVMTNTVDYSPIYQWFGWMGMGTTLQYKFRYQTGSGPFSVSGNDSSPSVYIVDLDGNVVTDVYGSNQYNPSLVSRSTWTYVSGSVTLPPATDYAIVLDGIPEDPESTYSKVYYDDVVVGTTSWAGLDDLCSNYLPGSADLDPTATPTTAPTNSPTPTITPTGTVATPTNTPFVPGTATGLPTKTITSTPRASTTPRATSSPWPSSTTIPSLTPRTPAPTRTPYYSTATPGPTSTVVPSSIPTATPENYMPPPPESNPGVYIPPPGTPEPDDDSWKGKPGIFVPGGPGGPGSPGDGSWYIECDRPTNPLSLAWWLDYERCMILSFVSWGPSQQATAQSIPAMFNQYEPFGTIAEVKDGMVVLRTQVAGISGELGYSGVNDPIDPSRVLNGAGSNDPWAEGGRINLFSQSGGITTGAYTNYCSHRLSSQLSGNLAKGACFALNVMKNVGVFPWVQFGINIASVLSIIVAALRIFGLAGAVAVYQSQTAADDEEAE